MTDDPILALNEEVRALIAKVRTLDAPADVLVEAAVALRRVNVALDEHTHPGPYQQAGLQGQVGPSELEARRQPHEIFPYSPIVGHRNPLSPPVRMWFDGERMHGEMTITPPYAGPPSTVHGGVVALVFDELLGALGVALGVGGFTGTLSVRYERPTPLLVPVQLSAVLDRIEGRKTFLRGEISHEGVVTARAEGLFIRSRQEASPSAGT
jgi:acyl-coenzyme A thioesterase PaaI-like protein